MITERITELAVTDITDEDREFVDLIAGGYDEDEDEDEPLREFVSDGSVHW